ncbi:MAG: hypothetical protein IPG81_19715 [Sandaracinaceae bacterium]|nr:hypothetical protein [Sandaracinaceae bacterium]
MNDPGQLLAEAQQTPEASVPQQKPLKQCPPEQSLDSSQEFPFGTSKTHVWKPVPSGSQCAFASQSASLSQKTSHRLGNEVPVQKMGGKRPQLLCWSLVEHAVASEVFRLVSQMLLMHVAYSLKPVQVEGDVHVRTSEYDAGQSSAFPQQSSPVRPSQQKPLVQKSFSQ